MKTKKVYLPRGVIQLVARKLGITRQNVYQRLKRNDEFTIDLLENVLRDYIKEQNERNQRAKLKLEFIKEQLKRFNGLS
ncbi:MAG: hypothetical protein CH6_0109 [Candidatus Kapaibacterium sp.]|nr:MAG: hypothetical protein CH6_0109 [Candidatus Kapabacteria bacterium]